MKVKIISESKGVSNTIIFSTEIGNGRALWEGVMPKVGEEYYVELEIPDVLVWEKDITISEKKEYCIGMANDKCYLVGMLESVDDDGYTVIRLGEGIVSLETEGIPFQLGNFVMIQTSELVLYQINY